MSKRNAKAYEVDNINHILPAGAYYFLCSFDSPNKPIGIIHGCPCGCGRASSLFFKGLGSGKPEWDVKGEWPNVTLSPSIGIGIPKENGFHWHGYLRNGVFEEV